MATKQPRKRVTLESKLQAALGEAGRRKTELAEAEAKLNPLRKLAAKAHKAAAILLTKYQQQAGFVIEAPATRRGRPKGAGKKRAYNMDPARKVEATIKRTHTRLKNSGVPEAEARKRAREAGDKLMKKLGL
jgi:hypothetical protein